MKKYLIQNHGCDDSTEFEMELTDEEVKFLIKVFEENNKYAYYQCTPRLYISDKYTKQARWYYSEHSLNKSYDELKEK